MRSASPAGKRKSSMEFLRTVRKFHSSLFSWYASYGRDLPWRKTSDPYRILVSEMMLQQTQVDRVIPKYHEFLVRYPTIRHLAKASQAEVRKAWYPLGHNIRPLRLHFVAREAVATYGGKLPSSQQDLMRFKGVGRYTSAAILNFAHRKEIPMVDTNIARVITRVFCGSKSKISKIPVRGSKISKISKILPKAGQPKAGQPKAGLPKAGTVKSREVWDLAEKLIPSGKGYDYHQALMDFGALVCLARAPRCPDCPMKRICRWVNSRGEARRLKGGSGTSLS